MKNSKLYAGKIVKLFKSLKSKSGKVKKVDFDDPVGSLIYAIVSERVPLKDAKVAIDRIETHFVDRNDLRVSRPEETVEVVGLRSDDVKKTASDLRKALNAIYDRYDEVSLVGFCENGKRQARKAIEDLDVLSRFVIDYCFLTAIKGHAIPLTQRMIDYLKAKKLVHPGSDYDDIEGFLCGQIAAANAYEFYSLLRKESESAKIVKKAVAVKDEPAVKKKAVKSLTKKTAKKAVKKKTVKKAKKKVKKAVKKAVKKTKEKTKKS